MKTLTCYCGMAILVEDCDYEVLSKTSWNCSSRSLQGKVDGATVGITHVIKGPPPGGFVWDHADRNCHNNLHNNLRLVTNEQNLQNKNTYSNNKSGCPGVSWVQRDQCWRVSVSVKGSKIHIGDFKVLEEAITARKAAEQKHYGQQAPSNTNKFAAFVALTK